MIKYEGTQLVDPVWISDLMQIDKSDLQYYPELYCGQYPVNRLVKIVAYSHSEEELSISYVIEYSYIKNSVRYGLNDTGGYSPINGTYYCRHDVGQKFEFDGVDPILNSYFPGDIGYDDPTLVTEYSMWSDLLITRTIKFVVNDVQTEVPVSFDKLITEAVKNLDSKYKLFDRH
jgi:hypothetical protein